MDRRRRLSLSGSRLGRNIHLYQLIATSELFQFYPTEQVPIIDNNHKTWKSLLPQLWSGAGHPPTRLLDDDLQGAISCPQHPDCITFWLLVTYSAI